MRKAARPDLYAIVGVGSKFATEAELKAAYKQRCLQWHPDKWTNQPVAAREAAEAKFKVLAKGGERG